MMSDAGMRPVSMNRPRGAAAGAVVRAQPVTETSLMESGMYSPYLNPASGINRENITIFS